MQFLSKAEPEPGGGLTFRFAAWKKRCGLFLDLDPADCRQPAEESRPLAISCAAALQALPVQVVVLRQSTAFTAAPAQDPSRALGSLQASGWAPRADRICAVGGRSGNGWRPGRSNKGWIQSKPTDASLHCGVRPTGLRSDHQLPTSSSSPNAGSPHGHDGRDIDADPCPVWSADVRFRCHSFKFCRSPSGRISRGCRGLAPGRPRRVYGRSGPIGVAVYLHDDTRTCRHWRPVSTTPAISGHLRSNTGTCRGSGAATACGRPFRTTARSSP